MASQRPATPEKQLLKLIEENKAQRNAPNLQAQALKYHHLSFLSLEAWLGRFSFFKGWLQKRLQGSRKRPFDIKVISQAVIIFIYILAAYFSFDFISSLVGLWKIPNLEIKSAEKISPLVFHANSVLKSTVSSYLENVRGRDVFRLGPGAGGATENKEATGPIPQAVSVGADLKLVGISWSSDPDAIIEDAKATKTYFVKVGDLVGDGKVQAIFKDKVVLRFGDQEIELK